jgi:2-iminobutanoate/2-iminopropanoate deaminase
LRDFEKPRQTNFHSGDLMPKKEVIQVNLAAANPNLSPATRFGDLVFVAGQTGRHPITGEVGRDVREQTRYAIERVKMVLETAGTSLDDVLTVLTHLTRRENLAAYNEEYAKFFPSNKSARNHRGSHVERPRTPCGDNCHRLHSRLIKVGIRHEASSNSRK